MKGHFSGLSRLLGYGVMVTLQILVLPFLVRVRVSQLLKLQSLRIVIGVSFCIYACEFIWIDAKKKRRHTFITVCDEVCLLVIVEFPYCSLVALIF